MSHAVGATCVVRLDGSQRSCPPVGFRVSVSLACPSCPCSTPQQQGLDVPQIGLRQVLNALAPQSPTLLGMRLEQEQGSFRPSLHRFDAPLRGLQKCTPAPTRGYNHVSSSHPQKCPLPPDFPVTAARIQRGCVRSARRQGQYTSPCSVQRSNAHRMPALHRVGHSRPRVAKHWMVERSTTDVAS